ncbi:MAG: hypothetical protein WAV27_02395 [Xanthobacteraceae bacterium]
MHCHVYLRKGTVYLPTMGEVEKGFYRGVEPVALVSVTNTESLRQALLATIARGNPTVPRLRRSEYPPPVLLKYAGVKTWSAFDRDASLWTISEAGGHFVIIPYKKRPTGESVQDQNDKIEFPPGSSADVVIERIISILQQTAQK